MFPAASRLSSRGGSPQAVGLRFDPSDSLLVSLCLTPARRQLGRALPLNHLFSAGCLRAQITSPVRSPENRFGAGMWGWMCSEQRCLWPVPWWSPTAHVTLQSPWLSQEYLLHLFKALGLFQKLCVNPEMGFKQLIGIDLSEWDRQTTCGIAPLEQGLANSSSKTF